VRDHKGPIPLSCMDSIKRGEDNKRPPVSAIYTDVSSVGDRSDSMSSTFGGSQHGAVAYMKKQFENAEKNKPIKGYHVEFTTFDTCAETHFNGDASQISEDVLDNVYDSMEPRGRTRLFDTTIEAVHRQMLRLNTVRSSLSKEVLCLVKNCPWLIAATTAVMTDGKDNESEPGSKETCKRILKQFRKEYGGVAFFIAANQDAASRASEYGFDPRFSLQMGNDRRSAINAASATAVAQYRSVSSGSSCQIPSYTQLERDSSVSRTVRFTNEVIPPIPTLRASNSIRRNLFQ
jgi:hypothetical protein